ncbi:MAG: aldo/keto reductase [Phocaeicola sp.]
MKDKKIDRRDFLKIMGIGAATSTAALAGCSSSKNSKENGQGGGKTIPTDKMEYRTFPQLEDHVSLLGYGCMRWPLLSNPAEGESVIDQEEVNDLVDYAIAHGVNYFDTSPLYIQGWSERATGNALSRHPRDKYYIATKMSNFNSCDYDFGVAMYEKSFKELQVDYIDYYLLHMLGGEGARGLQGRFIENGLLDFLLQEREAGRIRHLGWSFHGTKEGFDEALALHEKVHWDFVQIQLNYSDWENATGRNVNADYLYEELAKREIPVVVMEPLLGGRLAKIPTHVHDRLKERNPDGSVASWAFRFAGTPPMVLTVLSGMTYMDHLQDNIHSYSPLTPISKEEDEFLKETAKLMMQYPTIPCNDCQYCMPCPYGIDIPGVLLHYNKCVNEGNTPQSQQDPNYAAARRAFLVGYDRSVPKLRQAAYCIGCSKCVKHCPQRINIPRELHRIDDFVENLKQGTL